MSSDLHREEQRNGVNIALAKSSIQYCVLSPEGCDIFLLSLFAVLISLHMSWVKIEFVSRGRSRWLYHCFLIVFVSVCVYV